MADNWPLHAEDMRTAVQYKEGQDDWAELELFIGAACQRVDRETGRLSDPTRHEINGSVPLDFILAARALAKLRWKQEKRGPSAREDGSEAIGFDLPRWIEGLLAKYPPRLYPGDDA